METGEGLLFDTAARKLQAVVAEGLGSRAELVIWALTALLTGDVLLYFPKVQFIKGASPISSTCSED